MATLTKTVDGKPLPAEKFAMVGDPEDISTWHLPIDDAHIESALDMFGHEEHGTAEQKKTAARKIAAAARAKGIDSDRIKNFESKYAHGEGDGWIEIFRAGDYPGKATVTREDLQRVVDNYDPATHEAPVCIGHTKTNSPAYAWVEQLKLDGDTLLMKEHQVDPDFHKLRKAGRYKKRSTAFYPDANGRAAALRHVAYLGAEPPAVKGLKDVSFDDADRQVIEVEFGEEESVADKSVKDQIKEFFAELFTQREQRQFSEADVTTLVTNAVEAATKPLREQVTGLQTKLNEQATQFGERERKLVTAESDQRASAAVNKLKAAGKWVPAFDKLGVALLFSELAKDTKTLEFGEGDTKKKQTPLEILLAFMEAQPKIVPDGRTVVGTGGGARGERLNFTEGKGVKADQNSIALDAAVKELMKKDDKLSYGDALGRVIEEHPELTLPGGAQPGTV